MSERDIVFSHHYLREIFVGVVWLLHVHPGLWSWSPIIIMVFVAADLWQQRSGVGWLLCHILWCTLCLLKTAFNFKINSEGLVSVQSSVVTREIGILVLAYWIACIYIYISNHWVLYTCLYKHMLCERFWDKFNWFIPHSDYCAASLKHIEIMSPACSLQCVLNGLVPHGLKRSPLPHSLLQCQTSWLTGSSFVAQHCAFHLPLWRHHSCVWYLHSCSTLSAFFSWHICCDVLVLDIKAIHL